MKNRVRVNSICRISTLLYLDTLTGYLFINTHENEWYYLPI